MRVGKIVRRSHRPGAKPAVLMNTIMAGVTQQNAVIGTTHPAIIGISGPSQLIGHYMMSMVISVNQASTAMCTFIPLSEESLLPGVIGKTEGSGHIKFLLSGSGFFNFCW